MGKITQLPFHPLPFLRSGKSQTIVASHGLKVSTPSSEEWIFDLEQGDKLCCIVLAPKEWKEERGIVILLHGLGGSFRSHYVSRIASRLYKLGYRVVCINSRGCGCGAGLAKKLPHGGMTKDTLLVLKKIRRLYPLAPIQAVGYSMGGNILLNLLGELSKSGKRYLNRAIAVCPLVDFFDTCENMSQPSMRLFHDYYLKSLLNLVEIAEKAFPKEGKTVFPKNLMVYEYDRLYTVPKWGFKSVEDYYRKCSSSQFTPNIAVPCDLLYSADDPIIRCQSIESANYSSSVNLWRTLHGGHLGFLGFEKKFSGVRWMDEQILSWIEAF